MNTHLMKNQAGINIGQKWTRLFSLLLLLNLFAARPAGAASVEDQIAALKAQRDDAIFSVQHIVNQPVIHLKRTSDMRVSAFSPGWFHSGANTPDFDTVDIRTSQDTSPYAGNQYVTSDLNPGEVFLGNEVEFNSNTKYFYTDRSVPKKKLTEAEMLQVNDLYRIIGRCNQQLNELQNPPPLWIKADQWIAAHKPVVCGAVVALLVMLIVLRKRRPVESED